MTPTSLQPLVLVTSVYGKSVLSKSHREGITSPKGIKHKGQTLEITIDQKLLRLGIRSQANTFQLTL